MLNGVRAEQIPFLLPSLQHANTLELRVEGTPKPLDFVSETEPQKL